jgi:hypothetical protein
LGHHKFVTDLSVFKPGKWSIQVPLEFTATFAPRTFGSLLQGPFGHGYAVCGCWHMSLVKASSLRKMLILNYFCERFLFVGSMDRYGFVINVLKNVIWVALYPNP